MKLREFGYSIYSLNCENFQEKMLELLSFMETKYSLLTCKVTFPDEKQYYNINSLKDDIILKHRYINMYLQSEKGEYEITTGDSSQGFLIGIDFNMDFLIDKLPDKDAIFFLKQLLSRCSSTTIANAHFFDADIVYGLYEPFDFTGRHSSFTGFRWLNYLGAEEMALNGGDALYNLPYLTKAEPLGEGIFIQVGETPHDARTEEGKQQLFKATEAWWQMIQQKK